MLNELTMEAFINHLFEGISEEEADQFFSMLEKIKDNFYTVVGEG